MKKILLLNLTLLLFISCIGDKKTAIGTDFNTTSFVNKKFNNKMPLSDIKDVCSYVSAKQLAELYNVKEEDIVITKGNMISKICSFYVRLSDNKFDHIMGSISFYEEKDKQEDGGTWVESWQIRKNTSKSAKWIPNLGQAAYYRASKRELFVKLKDYTMCLRVPGSSFNKNEKAKNRDYKKIALAIVKNIDFLN